MFIVCDVEQLGLHSTRSPFCWLRHHSQQPNGPACMSVLLSPIKSEIVYMSQLARVHLFNTFFSSFWGEGGLMPPPGLCL